MLLYIGLVVGLVILLSHWACSMRHASSFDILQVRLSALHPDVFIERNPVVIEDRLANPADLLTATFKSMYIVARGPRQVVNDDDASARTQTTTAARYTILHNSAAHHRAHVTVQHPTGNLQPVVISLGPRQTLVLPPLWAFHVAKGGDVTELALYDLVFGVYAIIARALGFFFSSKHRIPENRLVWS
jgi:hypothetical protein